MTKRIISLTLAIMVASLTHAVQLVKAPGSTIDVLTELSLKSVLHADTLVIEGGTGSIYLQAGPADNGAPYLWDINSTYHSTHSVTFEYAHAVNTLSNGAKGTLVSVSRQNPLQTQYLWVVYQTTPLKPSTPVGEAAVCGGSTMAYTAMSENAESYQWHLHPAEAGSLQGETTNTVTVTWSNTWSGTASLWVQGVKGTDYSPASETISIQVSSAPAKPTLAGGTLASKGTAASYTGIAAGAETWSWFLSPEAMGTSTPSGNTTSITFTETGTATLTAFAANGCGDSPISDALTITVVDIDGLQATIDQLVADTTSQGIAYRETIALLSDQNSDLALEVQELSDSIISITTQLDQLTATLEGLQLDFYDISAENVALQADIITLYNTVDITRDSIATLELTVEGLNADIDLLLADVLSLTDSISVLAFDIVVLEDEVQYLAAENQALATQLDEQLTTIIALENQVDILQSENTGLQAEIEVLDATIVALEIMVDDLIATNTNLLSENSALESTNATLTQRIGELEQQVQTLSQVYILSWEVEGVTTHAFETEIGNFSISLYPNPSPGEVFIECTELIEEVKIYNLQGQLLKQQTVNSLETSFVVNRSEMPVGTYLVHIRTAKGNSTHRIIFQ